jgi:hypothetical protein
MKRVFLICLLTAGVALMPVPAWGQDGDVGAEDPVIPLPKSSCRPIGVGPFIGTEVLIERLDEPTLKKKKPISSQKLMCGGKSSPKAIKGQSKIETKLIFALPFNHEPPFGKHIFGDVTILDYKLGNIQESMSRRKICRCALYRRYRSSKENPYFPRRTLLLQKIGHVSMPDARKEIGNPGATFGVWNSCTKDEGVFADETGDNSKDPRANNILGKGKRGRWLVCTDGHEQVRQDIKKIIEKSVDNPALALLLTRSMAFRSFLSMPLDHTTSSGVQVIIGYYLPEGSCISSGPQPYVVVTPYPCAGKKGDHWSGNVPFFPVHSLLLQMPEKMTLKEARKILLAIKERELHDQTFSGSGIGIVCRSSSH